MIKSKKESKKEYKVLIGDSYESMLLSDEEIKIIDNYGKCQSDEWIMVTCNDGQKIPSYQIDDYKLV